MPEGQGIALRQERGEEGFLGFGTSCMAYIAISAANPNSDSGVRGGEHRVSLLFGAYMHKLSSTMLRPDHYY